jgi:hypothetical protein
MNRNFAPKIKPSPPIKILFRKKKKKMVLEVKDMTHFDEILKNAGEKYVFLDCW